MTSKELNDMLHKNDNSDTMAAVVGITLLLLAIPLMVYGIWANAYVGSTLWAWFIVPTFGLPALTMPQAWGISMLVSMWTKQMITCKSADERTTGEKIGEIVTAVIWPWAFLFFGWICHHFFMVAK